MSWGFRLRFPLPLKRRLLDGRLLGNDFLRWGFPSDLLCVPLRFCVFYLVVYFEL